MANKIHSIKPKEREFSNIAFYYTEKDIAVKVGIQFFRIVQDFANRRETMKALVGAVENNEIKDMNDLYIYMRKGYTLSPSSLDKFNQIVKGNK